MAELAIIIIGLIVTGLMFVLDAVISYDIPTWVCFIPLILALLITVAPYILDDI